MAVEYKNIDYEINTRPFKGETYCGDLGVVNVTGNTMYIAAIDVAGHGEKAAAIAAKTKTFINGNFASEPLELVEGLHEYLKGSRGCAGAFCVLDTDTGIMNYVGVGNIRARVIGNNKRFISRGGVIGYSLPKLQEDSFRLSKDDILLLYSDGIKEFFELEMPVAQSAISAADIANKVMAEYGSSTDDCMCIAIKCRA